MFITDAIVENKTELENQIFLLKLYSPEISRNIKPGQFINIRASENNFPLLRRPFSVCDVEGDYFFVMFKIYGEGTLYISRKQDGEKINVLGPLGNGFNLNDNSKTALLVAGGMGSAPFSFLTKIFSDKKEIHTFIGGRSSHDVIQYGLKNIYISTDDGSLGFKGNVIELLKNKINNFDKSELKIFACGPTPMLKALKEFALNEKIECEVSTECGMACGFGICQGCPIQSANDENKFLLVCKDGPVFNVKDIII